jgi:Flp pilus assembly protein TadG
MILPKSAQIQRETPAAFMSRFRRNKAGNTIAMFAMALVPMVAMSGSAVDVGRSYLVKTRLQQACDAGVLAGRRAMAGGTYGTAEQAQATSYFNTNMRNGATGGVDNWYSGATNVTFNSSAGANN